MPDTLPRDCTGGERSEEASQDYDPETDAPKEDEWDRQIERDAKAGRLDDIADRARAQIRAGHGTDLHGSPTGADTAAEEAQDQ